MNSLNAAVLDLAHEVSLFATHLDALKQADEHLEEWNQSFGRLTMSVALLQRHKRLLLADKGVELTASGKTYSAIAPGPTQDSARPEPPASGTDPDRRTEASSAQLRASTAQGKPPREPDPAPNAPKARAGGKNQRNTVDGSKLKGKTASASSWTRASRKVLARLPRKYQQPEHVKRLERIWCAIEAKPGSALGDLVRCCGCSVLQVNEYLATLVKHGLVIRKKTRTTLAYFVSSPKE